MEESAREMPRYRCHKEVWALKIKEVQVLADGTFILTPEDDGYGPIAYKDKTFGISVYIPRPGWYYVQFPDGTNGVWAPCRIDADYVRV